MRAPLRLEWPTLGLIGLCYGGWLFAGFWLYPSLPLLALAIMAVLAGLHSSLVHECLHGHPTRYRLVNEALVTLPLSLAYPYRRYKATHLAHHHDERLTDPFDDPESYYRARWQFERLPGWFRTLLTLNNTLLGRVILGPWLVAGGFFLDEARQAVANERGVRLAWAIHLPAMAVVLALVWAMGIPLWLYVLGVCWPGLSLIGIRTFAEHRWHETPSGRTIIVERSPLAWLFLYNNLHIVHHKQPSAPWYELPRLYRERRAEWQAMNGGYVFPNYWALWRLWGVTMKEPVIHPALHQEPQAGAGAV
ncbi:fatty acid desaturase [Cereibacter sphaeroides]|nr:fatty acid desaturase [Cereibacter sphaeroides]